MPEALRLKDREICLNALQATVSRLAGYSFGAKGWAITITSGFVVATATQRLPQLMLGAVLPCLFFWGLDAYYLMLERRFRARFLACLDGPERPPTSAIFVAAPHGADDTFRHAFFTKMLIAFYLPLAFVAGLLAVLVSA